MPRLRSARVACVRTLFERALKERRLPSTNVVVETSDLAVLRGVLPAILGAA